MHFYHKSAMLVMFMSSSTSYPFFAENDRRSFPSTESLPNTMSSPRSHLSSKSGDQTYQNLSQVQAAGVPPPKAKRSNSTSSSPPAHSATATHSSSSLYKKCSPLSQQSPPLHKAASQQIAREHSFDGSLYSRHGASFRRRGSAGINGAAATNATISSTSGLRNNNRTGGSMSGLLTGGLDLIPVDNPPPLPPPLNLVQNPPLPKTLPPAFPPSGHLKALNKGEQQELGGDGDSSKPQPAPRKQFLKSESVETGIGSGSCSNNSSNNSSLTNTKDSTNTDGLGTLGSSRSCNDDSVADGASTTPAGEGNKGRHIYTQIHISLHCISHLFLSLLLFSH